MSKEVIKTAVVGGITVVGLSYLAIRFFWPAHWVFILVFVGGMIFLPWQKIHRRVNKLPEP